MKTTDTRQKLFENMAKLNPDFKPNAKLLTEWNFDKKKGDVDKDEDKDDDKKKTSGKKKWNFGKEGLPWEKTDKAATLKEQAKGITPCKKK